MRTLCLLLFATSLVFADKPAKEAELKRTIAAGFVDLASWCQSKGLLAEGRPYVDEALSLDPESAKVKALKDKLAGDSTATDAARKELEGKRAQYGKKLAQLYRDLSKEKHPQKDDERFDGYLVRAFELDPKQIGPYLGQQANDAAQKREWARAYRLLAGAERSQPDAARAAKLREAELKCAEKQPIIRKASTHDMEYYLVLPKDWSPKRTWPVLVYVEGAGCNFRGAIDNYASQRGDDPYILVTPQTFSSTNQLSKDKYTYKQELIDTWQGGNRLGFDEEGLLAVLADLKRDFNAEERIFISGFSGGGNLTWRMVFGHPEMLVAAAPACPNFANAGTVSEAPERETLPVHVFQGEADEYLKTMLEAQWQGAKRLLDEHGYKSVERTLAPGVGHSAFVKEVLDFFRPHLAPKK